MPLNAKRFLDVSIAVSAVCALSPLFVIVAIGVKLSSPGPVFYRARRIAKDRRRVDVGENAVYRRAFPVERRRSTGYVGREFTLYKFRTMRVHSDAAPVTAWKDPRVFAFGEWLRATKIDELPQFVNIIRGEMALVGPRPEAPDIVRMHYSSDDVLTLQALPGLTSPGTLYYYTHCEHLLAGDSAFDVYVNRVLPLKLALDRVYLKRTTVFYDIRILARTASIILGRIFGRRRFTDPPELAEAI